MKKALSLALVLCLVFALTACGGGSNDGGTTEGGSTEAAGGTSSGGTTILTIGTADTGGTMYPVGAAIAKVINDNVDGVKVNVETSAGSPENVRNLQNGEIDLGMVSGDVAYEAYTGTKGFEGAQYEDIRVLAATYPSLSNWMVLESSGLEFVHELEGKRIAVGMTASTTEISAGIAIQAAGIDYPDGVSPQYIGLGEGADAVRDETAVATHGFAGIPIGGQLDLSNTKAARLLKYTDEHLDEVVRLNPSYYKAVIPAGTYAGQDEDVPTFGVKCTVSVSASLDDDLAYEMAKALAEHIPDLIAGHASMTAMEDPGFMCDDMPIPLHPGAERYYKEAGLLD